VNQIQGPLNVNFTLWTSLKYCLLQANEFTGTLPSTIVYATNLREFSVYKNKLVGEVRMELKERERDSFNSI